MTVGEPTRTLTLNTLDALVEPDQAIPVGSLDRLPGCPLTGDRSRELAFTGSEADNHDPVRAPATVSRGGLPMTVDTLMLEQRHDTRLRITRLRITGLRIDDLRTPASIAQALTPLLAKAA